MKTAFTLIFFALCFLVDSPWGRTGGVFAQARFQRAIGGGNYDYAYALTKTSDGGFVIAGSARSFGLDVYGDMYIVKLNAGGTLQWSRTVGGSSYDRAYSVIQTTDGGYAVAGVTNSFGPGSNNYEMYIVKLDGSGTLQWNKTIGGADEEAAYSIIQTMDGGYAVAGNTISFGAGSEDMYIVKLNSAGTLQWSRTIGGTDYDYAREIIQTPDSGYVAAGWTYSFGSGAADMYVMKLNSTGTLLWSRTAGGADYDRAYSMVQTTDGGFVMAGTTYSFGAGNDDMYIVKLDSTGTIRWSRTVGGTNWDVAYSVTRTSDGGFAVGGATISFGAGNDDVYIAKLDASGTLQWSKTAGGINAEYGWSVVQTTDGSYGVAGYTGSYGAGGYDMYLVKFDAGGNTCGSTSSPASQSGTGGVTTSPTSTVTSPTTSVNTPTSSIGVGGTVTAICTYVGIQPISNEIPGWFQLYQNYPNPFNPSTKIKFSIPPLKGDGGMNPLLRGVDAIGGRGVSVTLKIYDILGHEISVLVNEQLKSGTYEVKWDASNFPSGVYFFRLSATGGAGNFTETKKMILLK